MITSGNKMLNSMSFIVRIIILSLFPFLAFAEDEAFMAEVTVSGTVIKGIDCTINNNQPIYIDFGLVGVKKVESGIYKKEIPLVIGCDFVKPGGNYTVLFSVSGDKADFDKDNATIISRENENLGIKIYFGGVPLPLNEDINFYGNSASALEAVLVKKEGSELVQGDFSATATLKAYYQ